MKDQSELSAKIRQCQQGDPDGFGWLIHEFGTRLYSYFYRVSGSEAEAEDMLQEIYVKLLKHIRHYQHQDRFEHWLFRIAANLARDRIRRLKRQVKTLSIHQNDEERENESLSLAAAENRPIDRMLLQEQNTYLTAALDQLPMADREMILLRHYGGLSFKEIAEEYHMPLGTVLSKVHRGLKQLKRIMGHHEDQ